MNTMDVLSVTVMLALFILLLAFIFSAGLMTPIIGKKNLLFVVFIGFVAGTVGGAFLVSPVYDDIPEIARGIYISTEGGTETVTADVSAATDIVKLTEELRAQEGVVDVHSEGIVIKTDRFSEDRKRIIEDKISVIDSNITSWKVYTNGTIILQVKRGYNPVKALENLAEWLMYTGGINTRYSAVHLVVEVNPRNVDSVVSYLQARDIIVTGVKGPAEERVAALKSSLPAKSSIVLFCGVLGMLTGLAGVFIDSILGFVRGIYERYRGV
ncbi:hypothetical protein DNK57_01910 [Methanothermobacter thermautotrophicus]|uniref:Uncharacterized protein n=2 Tax=Methanothermobacter thermautotrophicus TaxID=145262 RepID=A0A842YJQ6_METTF|nr:hypothetical protein [Methanothermobacter thermautotrophicus]